MDPLGKKGEKAFEGVQNISQRLEQLESHLHAVDSALQNFMDDSQQILEQEYEMEKQEVQQLENSRKKNLEEEIESRVQDLEKKQHSIEKQLESLVEGDLLQTVSEAADTIEKLNKRLTDLRREVAGLQENMGTLEEDVKIELDGLDYDFEQKLDKSEFESEKVEMMEDIRKLRASVSILADELDKKDEIEAE